MPRRAGAAAAATLLALVTTALAGCGSDDPPLSPRPDLPTTQAEPLWNPCHALDPDRVERAFATTFTQRTGTDSAPECTFTPTDDGGVAVDVNYQLYEGTLRDVVQLLGDPTAVGATLRAPRVPGANGARILSSIDGDTLAVTGFVRNGRLVQVVNAIDPSPFDRARTVAGVRELLGDLAARADESGLSGG